ncbi:hypothetical protein ACLESD_45660, partial [Pyxidicoccus sp. 3LFB2]
MHMNPTRLGRVALTSLLLLAGACDDNDTSDPVDAGLQSPDAGLADAGPQGPDAGLADAGAQ